MPQAELRYLPRRAELSSTRPVARPRHPTERPRKRRVFRWKHRGSAVRWSRWWSARNPSRRSLMKKGWRFSRAPALWSPSRVFASGTRSLNPVCSSGESCKPSVPSKSTALCISLYGWNKADLFIDALRRVGFRVIGHLVFRKKYPSSTRFLRYQHERTYVLAKGSGGRCRRLFACFGPEDPKRRPRAETMVNY